MGIPGLWSELEPTAKQVLLPSIAYDAFAENHNDLRAIRIGIDASLWLYHSHESMGGCNLFLRVLFFRLARLLSLPILPIFVFDGPDRPSWKRGKNIYPTRQNGLENHFITLIEAFGFLHKRAPGEAEAELAWLNTNHLIDAVMTDDSDTLLFGAHIVIRNWGYKPRAKPSDSAACNSSPEKFTSGTIPNFAEYCSAVEKARERKITGTLKGHMVVMYNLKDIQNHPDLGLKRGDLILVALLSGGDYDVHGLSQCGVKSAIALGRAGFGTSLIRAFQKSYPSQEVSSNCKRFQMFLSEWLEEVRQELRTNSRGFLPSKKPQLASNFTSTFLRTEPSRKVLAYYVWPLTSSTTDPNSRHFELEWSQPNIQALASCAQRYFEWKDSTVLDRFRSTLWQGVILRHLRQQALELNSGSSYGPWAALIESPASKAVRQSYYHQTSSTQTSSSSIIPLHDSPNATRITDFFAKTSIASNLNVPHETFVGTPSLRPPPEYNDNIDTITIVSISKQRRHISLVPHLEYRALIHVENLVTETKFGLNPFLSAKHDQNIMFRSDEKQEFKDLTSEDEQDQDDKVRMIKTNQPKDPNKPLLIWIVESVVEQSQSGKQALLNFKTKLEELEKKKKEKLLRQQRKNMLIVEENIMSHYNHITKVAQSKSTITQQQHSKQPINVKSSTVQDTNGIEFVGFATSRPVVSVPTNSLVPLKKDDNKKSRARQDNLSFSSDSDLGFSNFLRKNQKSPRKDTNHHHHNGKAKATTTVTTTTGRLKKPKSKPSQKAMAELTSGSDDDNIRVHSIPLGLQLRLASSKPLVVASFSSSSRPVQAKVDKREISVITISSDSE